MLDNIYGKDAAILPAFKALAHGLGDLLHIRICILASGYTDEIYAILRDVRRFVEPMPSASAPHPRTNGIAFHAHLYGYSLCQIFTARAINPAMAYHTGANTRRYGMIVRVITMSMTVRLPRFILSLDTNALRRSMFRRRH